MQVQDRIQEVYLNGFGQQLIGQEKINEKDVNNSRIIEVYIAVSYVNSIDSFTYDKILEIKNYGDHIRVQEFYKSFLGEVTVEKVLYGIKPSEFLKILFPKLDFN